MAWHWESGQIMGMPYVDGTAAQMTVTLSGTSSSRTSSTKDNMRPQFAWCTIPQSGHDEG